MEFKLQSDHNDSKTILTEDLPTDKKIYQCRYPPGASAEQPRTPVKYIVPGNNPRGSTEASCLSNLKKAFNFFDCSRGDDFGYISTNLTHKLQEKPLYRLNRCCT